MINTLTNIYKEQGKEFIERLFNSHIIVCEQIDGSRFLFQKLPDNNLIFYKRDNEQINYIDRTLMKFYENAIAYVEGLPIATKANLPDNWTFGFQYFPSSAPINITYDRMPKNRLILTDISIRNEAGRIVKVIHDPKVLRDWATKLDVEQPPIIFNGKLSDYQQQQLKQFLDTPDEDLYQLFKTTSFTRYIISILNPALTRSTLMNDLEKSIEGIIFKFINPGKTELVSARLVDPMFYYTSKSIPEKPRKSNDMYQIVMLDIVEFFEQINIDEVLLTDGTPEERYVQLISMIFNDYVAKNGHRYFGIDFESPDFSKRQEFDVNLDFIKDARTRELIQNDHLRNLFKIMLSSFRKFRKNPTDILTQTIIDSINSIITKIDNKIMDNEKKFDNVLDFENFLKKTHIQEANSEFEQEIFEGLNLYTTKQGKKKVNIFVGRFQPFTLGHAKVFETLYKENKLPVVVLIVRSGKRPDERAPFDEDTQMMMFGAMQKEYKFLEGIFITSNAAIDSIFNQLRPAYEPVLWGTGTDRYSSYSKQIKRYREELNALDELEAFEIKRGDEDISATKVRNALKIGDNDTFKKMVPKSLHRYFKELKYVVEQLSEKTALTFTEFIKTDKINESVEQPTEERFTHIFKPENKTEE
jgi:nicotinic acid mononucleotide adenylyltransferase